MNLNELNNLSKGGSDKVAEDSLGLGIVWQKNTNADWQELEATNKRLVEIANNQQPVDNSFFGNVKTAIEFAAKPMSGQVEPIASMLNSAYEAFKPSGLYKKYMSSKDDVLREAKAISIETGIPENAILASHESLVAARDIKAYRDKQMKLAPAGQNDFSNEAIYKAYPELKNLSETDSAIALSDIENVLVSRSIIVNIRRGYEIAMLGRRRSDLGVKKGWGGGLSAEEEKELAGIGDKISDVGEVIDASQDLLAGIAGQTTMQIPRLVRGGIKGQALGLAAAGAVAMGGFAITKNPTLSAAAAQRAYQVGSKYGMMEDMFQEMAGNYYLDFLDMKGDDGKQLLSDDLAIAGAVIVGGINTYAEFANYGAILNVLGGSGKKAVVKEIIANYKNNPVLMQGLRRYAASASKSTAKALLMELGEEGVQDAVEKIAHNVIVSTARPNNYKTHSIGDIARGAVGAMYDAAPSAIGLGVLLNAGAASSNIRSMANAMRIRDENSRNELRTVALTSMTGDIVNNKQVKELYAKDPDIAKKVIKEQLPEEFKEVRIDTELLAEKDGGGEFLAAVAKNAGVGADELQATIENKAELVVPTEVYFQTRNEQSGSDYVDEHISANVDSVSTARRKQQAEQFQKEMESLLSEEGKAQVSLLDSIIESNFPQGDPNRDLAAGVIMTNPQNPSDGWKQAYSIVDNSINEILSPLIKQDESGKQLPQDSVIANALNGSLEEQTYIANNKAELDSLFEQKKALDDIKGRISGLTTSEIGIAKGLSKEGYKLYKNVSDQLIQSDNKDVSKAGRMGAILLARHADRVAEIMNQSGKRSYTAMDYYKSLGIEASATKATGGTLNQKAMLAEQKLNADSQAWGDNIDTVFNGKIKNNSAIKMMQTPLVLQNIGLEDLPIVMHPSKLKKILKDHPEMSPDILKQIPEHMADPMAVFPSDTSIGNMIVALELTDNKDNNVIVPIELSASAGRYNANIATSAYGKESKKWFADSFENKKGQPLYLNNKKITNWYSANRRQLPYGNYQSSDFFDNSIYNENDLVNSRLQNPTAYQNKNTVQGQFATMNNGEKIISLFSSADKSTFVHELGHLFLSDIKELAEMPDAPAWLKKDWETTKTFLGWKSGQTEFTTAQHEKFANSFVSYLMSGEAPIGGLRPVFRRFKQWLSKLYTDFIHLGGEPSKDIKAVMSRMIATQEEVDASIKLAGWKDFVKKGGTTFLDDKTSAMYSRWMDSAKEEAYEQTLRQAMQDYREQLDQDRQVMIDSERGRIQEELLSSVPAFLASEAVKQTRQEDIVLELGFASVQEYRTALQEAGGTLENAVDDHMESFVRELNADTIDESKIREYAESAVKDSRYQELLRAAEYEALTKINADTNTKANGAIKKMEKAFKALTEETDQEKIQSLQDEVAQLKKELEYNCRWSIAERNLIQDIATAKHDDAVKQLKKIVKEKTTGVRVLRDEAIGTSQMYKDYAVNRLATMPLHQAIDHKQWLKLSNRRNQEFLAELAKGNYQQAQRIKREQLLYASMAAQADKNAKAVSKDLGKIKKRMGSMLSGNVQMPIDERYHYENLLRQFGIYSSSKPIPQPIDPKSLESVFAKYNEDKEIDLDNSDGDPNSSMLPAWITAVASGANMNSAVFSETGSRIISYNTLSMDEFKTLADVLNTIYTVGRDYNKTKSIVDAMGNKIELSQAVSDIVGSAIKNIRVSSAPDPYGVSGTTFGSAISGGIGRFNVMLLKPETIFDRIDGGIHGFAQKYLYDPLNKSMNTERAMQANVGRQLEEALDLYSGVELAQLRYRKNYKFLGQSVTRETIISLALNWGTEINRKRIMDGFNISERDVNNALAQLDSKDWEFTARVWGIVGQYWNETVALEERMTGTTLVKQEATPFIIKGNDGQEYSMAGGYYPIAYNSEKSSRAADLKQDDIAKSNMSGNSVFGTRRGHTKSRTAQAVNRPVLLSFDVMTKHMDDVIHNIAFRESLRDVNRIINSKEMQALLDDERYFGVATNQMLKQWVKDNWKQESATNFGEKVAEIARKNQVIATLGYSVSTAVLNILNLFPMMYELGPIDALSAIKNFAAKPMDNYSFVIEKSSMMRNRAQSMDAAAREIMKEKLPSIQNNMLTKNAFWLQAKTDEMLSMPLWFASYKEAYNSELKKLQGFDMVVDADALARVDQMAITLADKAVRRVFGSGDVKDLSAVQRSNAFIKMLTPYYSYFNTVYNAIARRHYAAKDSGWALKQTTQLANAYLMWIILQSVAESLLREAFKSDDERKKDKRKWHVKLAHSSIDNSVGSIPVFRDAVTMSTAYIFDGGRNASLRSPTFMEAINRAERVMQTVSQIQGANRANKDWIDFLKESNRVGNGVFGVPDALTDSVWTTARWIDSDFDQGISEYLRALLLKKKLNK